MYNYVVFIRKHFIGKMTTLARLAGGQQMGCRCNNHDLKKLVAFLLQGIFKE